MAVSRYLKRWQPMSRAIDMFSSKMPLRLMPCWQQIQKCGDPKWWKSKLTFGGWIKEITAWINHRSWGSILCHDKLFCSLMSLTLNLFVQCQTWGTDTWKPEEVWGNLHCQSSHNREFQKARSCGSTYKRFYINHQIRVFSLFFSFVFSVILKKKTLTQPCLTITSNKP